MKPSTYVLALAAVALFSGAAGWYLAHLGMESEVERLDNQNAGYVRKLVELESSIEFYKASRKPREPEAPPDGDVPHTTSVAAAPAPASGIAGVPGEALVLGMPTPAKRAARTAELRADFDRWFAEGEGEKALEALKELATLVPEAREAAMELAVRINQDVNGEGKLKLSQMVFYTNLGSPAITGLFNWSLENESPADFRQMAVYSLPWTQPQDKTLAKFTEMLRDEKDQGVQRALVYNLSQMRRPDADKALAGLVKNPEGDAVVRTQALTALALSDDESVARTIEDVAYGDPDPTVRGAAKAALQMRNPPATGFMVTGTLPQSQAEAAGMKAGDIIVSYAGSPTRSLEDLRRAAASSSTNQAVEIMVIREGRSVPLKLRPGQMGIFGREVEKE